MDRIDRIGPKWVEWTECDWTRLRWTKMEQMGQ